jgi:hypothetical protein
MAIDAGTFPVLFGARILEVVLLAETNPKRLVVGKIEGVGIEGG